MSTSLAVAPAPIVNANTLPPIKEKRGSRRRLAPISAIAERIAAAEVERHEQRLVFSCAPGTAGEDKHPMKLTLAALEESKAANPRATDRHRFHKMGFEVSEAAGFFVAPHTVTTNDDYGAAAAVPVEVALRMAHNHAALARTAEILNAAGGGGSSPRRSLVAMMSSGPHATVPRPPATSILEGGYRGNDGTVRRPTRNVDIVPDFGSRAVVSDLQSCIDNPERDVFTSFSGPFAGVRKDIIIGPPPAAAGSAAARSRRDQVDLIRRTLQGEVQNLQRHPPPPPPPRRAVLPATQGRDVATKSLLETATRNAVASAVPTTDTPGRIPTPPPPVGGSVRTHMHIDRWNNGAEPATPDLPASTPTIAGASPLMSAGSMLGTFASAAANSGGLSPRAFAASGPTSLAALKARDVCPSMVVAALSARAATQCIPALPGPSTTASPSPRPSSRRSRPNSMSPRAAAAARGTSIAGVNDAVAALVQRLNLQGGGDDSPHGSEYYDNGSRALPNEDEDGAGSESGARSTNQSFAFGAAPFGLNGGSSGVGLQQQSVLAPSGTVGDSTTADALAFSGADISSPRARSQLAEAMDAGAADQHPTPSSDGDPATRYGPNAATAGVAVGELRRLFNEYHPAAAASESPAPLVGAGAAGLGGASGPLGRGLAARTSSGLGNLFATRATGVATTARAPSVARSTVTGGASSARVVAMPRLEAESIFGDAGNGLGEGSGGGLMSNAMATARSSNLALTTASASPRALRLRAAGGRVGHALAAATVTSSGGASSIATPQTAAMNTSRTLSVRVQNAHVQQP